MLASRVYEHVISVVLRIYDLLMSSKIDFDGNINFRSCKCSMIVDKKWSDLLRWPKLDVDWKLLVSHVFDCSMFVSLRTCDL